jgi:hypothetical protein
MSLIWWIQDDTDVEYPYIEPPVVRNDPVDYLPAPYPLVRYDLPATSIFEVFGSPVTSISLSRYDVQVTTTPLTVDLGNKVIGALEQLRRIP